MVCKRKGQASFEFMGTYMWALIALVIVFTALSFFGVFESDNQIPDSCTLGDGLGCPDVQIERKDSETYFFDMGIVNTNDQRVAIESVKIRKKGSDEYCTSSGILSLDGNPADGNISSLGSRKELRFLMSEDADCDFDQSGIELGVNTRENFDIIVVYKKGKSDLPVSSSGTVLATLRGEESAVVTPPTCARSSTHCGYSKCGTDAPGWTIHGGNCYVDTCGGTPCNNVPYFDLSMPRYYWYEKGVHTNAVIVDLSLHGRDSDGPNSLTYSIESINPSEGSGALTNCILQHQKEIFCVFSGNEGVHVFNVSANDGLVKGYELLTVNVSEAVNLPPEFNASLSSTYTKELMAGSVFIVDLAPPNSYDPEKNYPLKYYVQQEDSSVATCSLQDLSKVYCTLHQTGSQNFEVLVGDGVTNTSKILTLTVTPEPNDPPKFLQSLPKEYFRESNTGIHQLVNLSLHSDDPDNDPLSFVVISQTNLAAAECKIDFLENLSCKALDPGVSSIVLEVSDGKGGSAQTDVDIVINDPGVNETPRFTSLLTDYYELNMDDLGTDYVLVGGLAPPNSSDPEGDAMYYFGKNFEVSPYITCDPNALPGLKCKLLSVGVATMSVIVGDGNSNSSPKELTFNVTNDAMSNQAPFFHGIPVPLTIPYSPSTSYVVNLSEYTTDPEGVYPLEFTVDLSKLDLSVLKCDHTPGSELVSCQLIGSGETEIAVAASDGSLSNNTVILIKVTSAESKCTPTASCCGGSGFSPDGGSTCFSDNKCLTSCSSTQQVVLDLKNSYNMISVPVDESRSLYEIFESMCVSDSSFMLSDGMGNFMKHEKGSCKNNGIGYAQLLDAYVVALGSTKTTVTVEGELPSTPKTKVFKPGTANYFSVPITLTKIPFHDVFPEDLFGKVIDNISNDEGTVCKYSVSGMNCKIQLTPGEGYIAHVSKDYTYDMSAYIK